MQKQTILKDLIQLWHHHSVNLPICNDHLFDLFCYDVTVVLAFARSRRNCLHLPPFGMILIHFSVIYCLNSWGRGHLEELLCDVRTHWYS